VFHKNGLKSFTFFFKSKYKPIWMLIKTHDI
jgi:hypothetical protein